jgi:hypothetical protein
LDLGRLDARSFAGTGSLFDQSLIYARVDRHPLGITTPVGATRRLGQRQQSD